MPREVCLYGPIYSDSAETFINKLNTVIDDGGEGKVKVRVNTGGGEPEYAWGMVTKIIEHKENVKLQVDGKAHSAGFFALCYVDGSTGIDTSQYLIHRAAYPEYVERDPDWFTPEMQANLKNINTNLEKAVRGKIDVEKFEALGRGTIKEIFSMEGRKSVQLNAKEAKKVGLISEIIQITPSIKAEISSRERKIGEMFERVAAEYLEDGQRNLPFNKPKAAEPDENEEEKIEAPKIIKAMIVAEIKEKFPQAYASIFEEGKKVGVEAEQDRVGAWSTFAEIDPVAVKDGIKSGKPMSQTQMAEFSLKALSPERMAQIEKGNPPVVKTEEEKQDSQKKEAVSTFDKQIRERLGLEAKAKINSPMTLVQFHVN
jgi:ATP-dependent protease ClpP protease subunit